MQPRDTYTNEFVSGDYSMLIFKSFALRDLWSKALPKYTFTKIY